MLPQDLEKQKRFCYCYLTVFRCVIFLPIVTLLYTVVLYLLPIMSAKNKQKESTNYSVSVKTKYLQSFINPSLYMYTGKMKKTKHKKKRQLPLLTDYVLSW